MTRPLFLVGILCWASIGMADDPTDGRVEGANLATNKRGALDTILSTDPTEDSVPGFAGTSKMPQAKFGHSQLINADEMQLDETGEKVRGAFGTLPDWDEPAGTTAYGLSVQDDPLGVEGLGTMLNNNYASCTPVVTPASSSIDQFCDGWQSEATEACTIKRGITVHANDRFECSRDNPRQRVHCTRTLTKYCTREYEGQDVAEVIENLEFSDLAGSSNSDGSFTIGKPERRRWAPGRGSCSSYTAQMEFTIPNIDVIDEFVLTDVWFDDWTQIKVNGQSVYVGPNGDDFADDIALVITYGERYCAQENRGGQCIRYSRPSYRNIVQDGRRLGSCERATAWHVQVTTDIRPYLRVGRNTLTATTFVEGQGDFRARFTTRFRKCNDFTETWSEQCE